MALCAVFIAGGMTLLSLIPIFVPKDVSVSSEHSKKDLLCQVFILFAQY